MDAIRIPETFLRPNYAGGSLANIPGTVAALLEHQIDGLPPLHEKYWSPVAGQTKRVILILLDSLGWELYQRERPGLDWFASRLAVEKPITTVFPSTTVAALSSLWTGYAPAQHGMVGLRLFFPQLAVLGQTISFGPTFARMPGVLIDAGLDVEQFLAVPGFAEQLKPAGIDSYSLKSHYIVRSALSIMHDRGITRQFSFHSQVDMFVQLRQLLEDTVGQRLYAAAYWPAIDTICHFRGPDHPATGAELVASLDLLKSEVLERLSPSARSDTVFIITGDHGHVATPPEMAIKVQDHPVLEEMLLMRPAGEPRTVYLYGRQGCQKGIVDYLNSNLSHALIAYPANQVLSSGLLGPKPHAPDVARRLGDVVVLMRKGYTFLSRKEAAESDRFIGLHGGMTKEEIEIPWLLLPAEA